MPIRENILRKGKAPKQNLLGFDVFQEETGVLGDLSTSKFFRISEFPAVLPTGNSSFLIEGSDLLRPNVEIKTELLDSAGNPIFHYAIPNYQKELPARRITIEVYFDDVINGIGSFTVLGELDPRKIEVPTAFQDTYNVRFTAPISINKNIKNTQPIRFYGDPTLTISEQVKSVIEKVPTGGVKTKTITGSVSLNVSTPSTADYGAVGSTTADSTQIEEVGNNQSSYISQNTGEAQSSILGNSLVSSKPYVTYVVEEMEKGIDNELDKITSAMQGATLSINRPDLLVDTSVYPNAKFTKPTTFSTKILNVLNSTTFTTTTQYKIKSKLNDQELIVPLNASSSGTTITHNVVSSTSTESGVFKRSYANMTVGNLRTFSGDTYKAKIYMKEDGSSGEFEKIYETLVESPNELVDKNSTTGFKNIGIFPTQSIVTDFWVSSSNTFTATQDDDTIIDGILLSGSTEPNGNSFTFETSQSYDLQKNEVYVVDFDVAFKPQNKVQSDGTTKKDAKLEVFLTGPIVSETGQEFALGEVDLGEYDFNKVNIFTKVKQKQISDFLTHNETNTPSGSLGFRLHSGEFILSDVRLRPFSELNFSPGFFKANVPMPAPTKRGKAYDFVVELYDANNNLAEAVAVADDVTFVGAPQVIVGEDNVLTGSLFLGTEANSGIETHGGSAYIKSVGYPGFESSSASGVGGFLMFSGSVSESLQTSESYSGVGLELVSGSNKFLRFRTTPSIFQVVTDEFFLGSGSTAVGAAGTGSFISGSNGNIEISSSNFHLDRDGAITMQGTITAETGGTIGGFSINDTDLTATNFVLDTDAKRLTIGTGNAIFVADADEGIFLGNANSGSAPFRVNREGDLVATSVTVTGEVNASSGTTATSITALGIATSSLSGSVESINTETGSLQGNVTALGVATASLSGSVEAVNAETGSVRTSLSAVGTATASLNIQSGSFLAHSASMNLHTASVNTTTGSLVSSSTAVITDVADTRAQLVLDNSTAGDQKVNLVNTTGGIMSSFGKGVKFFGSASNALVTASANGTVNYSEVNDKGFLIVTGSTTASFFGNTTTIGDTTAQHISIEPDSLSIKTANNVTALSASSAGIVMSGSITATEGNIGGFKINNQELSASGLTISATDQKILITGSNDITDGNSVFLDGATGVIQVSQSGAGIFDSGRTSQFETSVVIEPPVFKPRTVVRENISSSINIDPPVTTMTAANSTNLKASTFNVQKYIQRTTGVSNTPFYYQDIAGGANLNPNARLTGGGNPTSSVFFGVSRNVTAVDITGSLFGPEFVFSADYFTDSNIETRGLFGFVSSSATGSNIFTINTRISRSVADQDVNFGDAKFNLLGLETDTSGLANARQNEYTFLQAKHSQSIRLQIQHDGDIVSKGNITAFGTSFLSVSDEREKEYIYQISESLNKVLELRPTKFTWKETQKEDVGFIAQEVEKVIPEVVETTKGFINTDEDMNRKTISYPKLIPYLVDTIQELTKRIEKLEKKVK